MTASLRSSKVFAAACVLFFLSGALGLGYELVWIRKAALVVGASQIALATVLTAFFLGLGLGSYVVGHRWARGRLPPLILYGIFEAAIGVFALAFPALFDLLEEIYSALYPLAAGSGAALFALRFALLFILFLPPTFCMGATLPLLLDALVDRERAIGSRTSFLYGINILGAVAGVLVTCYAAIPALGMNGTSVAGGIGNLAIALAALVAFRGARAPHEEHELAKLHLFFPLAAFASGLLAIAYQVLWARYFTLFHTTTVYMTAMLLAVYLLGLAAGSFGLAPLLRLRGNPLRILSALQALIPVAALLTLEWWRVADYRFALLGRLENGRVVPLETLEIDPNYESFWAFWSEHADAVFFAPLFQIALSIFLPVLLIGAGLPSLITAATRTASGLRSAAGRVVFWNTLGSSAGGFAAGYILLPFLGLHWSFAALALGSVGLSAAAHAYAPLASGVAASAPAKGAPPRPKLKPAAGLLLPLLGFLLALALLLGREDITRSTIRKYGYGRDPGAAGLELVEVVEGPLTSSFVFEDASSVQMGSGNVCLAVAYKRGFSTQAFQGHIPCLFYPGEGYPQDCLGICLGSGQSFGALLLYPIRRLDVVDISEEIVDLCLKRFAPYNHGLSREHPKVRFHLDDGRHFVERAPDDSYDVVSMEPPPPTADGVYSLYSLEFYREIERILRSGGVFMQWLPLYRVTPLDARGILATQAAVFPQTFVVKVGKDDFMVVSYEQPPRIPLSALEARARTLRKEWEIKGWSARRWSRSSRHDIYSTEGLLALLVAGPEEVRAVAQGVEVYRDDTMRLSYSSGDRWLLRRYEGPALSDLSFRALELSPYEKLSRYFDPPIDAAAARKLERERAAALEFFHVPDPQRLESEVRGFREAVDPAVRARHAWTLAAFQARALEIEEAFEWFGRGLEAVPEVEESAILALGRFLARNRVAVYEDRIRKALAALERRFRASPAYKAAEAEFRAYERREAERLSRYLFPARPR